MIRYNYITILRIAFSLMLLNDFGSLAHAQNVEICDNAKDDDGDGRVDINDSDCICMVIEPISLIPNPSFEEISCCPSGRAELDCANSWIQASAPTTDLLHTCGWFGFDNFPVPLPLPDGEGIMGFRDGRVTGQGNAETNWKEYAGACLNAPLLPGTTYRFEFEVGFVDLIVSPGISVTFFGAPSCGLLPFGGSDIAFGCPTNAAGWVKLGEVFLQGTSGWVKTKIEVTPTQEINTIAIGPPCQATSANVSTYYFFDNLILADLESFELTITPVLHPCNENFSLSILELEGYDYQWYRNGVAIIGATTSVLDDVEEGFYQVRLSNEMDCRVTSGFSHMVPVISETVSLNICENDVLPFGERILSETGFYRDTFISINGCDSIVNLNLNKLTTRHDTIYISIFEGNNYMIEGRNISDEGESIIPATDQYGCDLYIHAFIDYITTIFPNVFSPNNDGRNDFFNLADSGNNIYTERLMIFDRWGNKMAELYNLLPGQFNGWDGTYNGVKVEPGVYTYIADVVSDPEESRTFTGTVLVLE